MQRYYSQNLSADRPRLCYEIASPRIKWYLAAEIKFVLHRVTTTSVVLELGCGYGRVLRELLTKAQAVFGVDTSEDSLRLAREIVGGSSLSSFVSDGCCETGFP